MSGTPGGKGSPAVLDIRASTFNDVGFNVNPQIEGLILNEIPDTTPPRITDVSLDYGTGILIFDTTENIDVTPVSKLNLSMFNIYDANVAKEQFNQERYYRYYGGTTINLGGANATTIDDTRITVYLTEAQRAAAISIAEVPNIISVFGDATSPTEALSSSGLTPMTGPTAPDPDFSRYWDPGPLVLDVVPGGALDIAQNPNAAISTCLFTGCNQLPPGTSECFCPLRGLQISGVPDTIKPFVSGVEFDFGRGRIKVFCSETIANSLINISKIRIYNDTDAAPLILQGAKIEGQTDPIVTLKIKEADRITLLQSAGTVGGDGIPLVVDIDENAFMDLGRNGQSQVLLTGQNVKEIPDLLGPTLTRVDLFYSNATMIVYGDETIDVTLLSLVNISRFFVSEDSNTNDISLHGATVKTSKQQFFEVILTPEQIGKAVKLSNAYDGSPVVLNVLANASQDLAGNLNDAQFGIQVTEYPDIIPPLIVGATVDYSNSILFITGNEVLDGLRSHLSNATRFVISKTSGNAFSDGRYSIRMSGSTLIDGDGITIRFKMPEATRLFLQSNSKLATGSDDDQYYLKVEEGAINDLSTNPNVANLNVSLPELPDKRDPAFTHAVVDLGSGNVTIFADETLDTTKLYATPSTLGFFYLSNTSGQKLISLGESTIRETSGNFIKLRVNELTRVKLIQMSNTTGGDYSPLLLDVEGYAIKDVVGNNNTDQFGIFVEEVADTRQCIITTVVADYNIGRITVTVDEILDLTPSSKIDGSKIFYGGYKDNMEQFNNINSEDFLLNEVRSPMTSSITQVAGTTSTILNYPLSASGGITIESITDSYSLSFLMPEASRVAAMQFSGTRGGGLNSEAKTLFEFHESAFVDIAQVPNRFTLFVDTHEIADTTPPKVIGASIDLGTGELNITCSEIVNADPTYTGRLSSKPQFPARGVDLSLIYLYNHGASDPYVYSIENTNATVAETTIYLQGYSFDGVINDNFIPGTAWTATVIPARSTTFTIHLTEEQRVAALRMSNTSGGDGTPLRLGATNRVCIDQNPNVSCTNSSAFRDMAGNDNNGIDSLEIEVTEIPDSVRPNLDQAGKTHDEVTPALNYITSFLYLIFDEIIDSTPASYVDLSKITIMDRNNANERSLAGSTVTELDRNTVKILLNTPAMQHALSILDEAESVEMQITKPIQINIFEGAVRDLAGNPNNPLTEIELLDHNNSRGVPNVKSISFESITADYFKFLKVFGQKRLRRDEMKFVDHDTTDCESAAARGGLIVKGTYSPQDNPIVNGVLLPPYAGIEVAFTEVSPPGKPFRLCYNFYFSKDEGYQLIDDVFVTVRKITNVNVDVGSNNVSVVGYSKKFTFLGNNTLASDRVKWVTGDAVDDADCNNGSALQTPLGGIEGQNVYGSILNVTQYQRYEYFESVD